MADGWYLASFALDSSSGTSTAISLRLRSPTLGSYNQVSYYLVSTK